MKSSTVQFDFLTGFEYKLYIKIPKASGQKVLENQPKKKTKDILKSFIVSNRTINPRLIMTSKIWALTLIN